MSRCPLGCHSKRRREAPESKESRAEAGVGTAYAEKQCTAEDHRQCVFIAVLPGLPNVEGLSGCGKSPRCFRLRAPLKVTGWGKAKHSLTYGVRSFCDEFLHAHLLDAA